jgi:hypothetical protein
MATSIGCLDVRAMRPRTPWKDGEDIALVEGIQKVILYGGDGMRSEPG